MSQSFGIQGLAKTFPLTLIVSLINLSCPNRPLAIQDVKCAESMPIYSDVVSNHHPKWHRLTSSSLSKRLSQIRLIRENNFDVTVAASH
jgi:hypothetical protein